MFTFKGETSISHGLRETAVKHTVLPPISAKTIELPFHDGVLDFGRVYGSRTIEVTVGLKGSTYGDLRSKTRQIARWLDSEKLQPLIFSDEPNIQYMARVSEDTSIDQLLYYGETTIKFLVPKPFGEDVHETTMNISSGQTINYDGTRACYPVFMVTTTNALSDFQISNGSEKVKIVTELPVGSNLVIDMNTGKVTLNGTVIQQTITIDSDFFPLKVGSNVINFSSGATVQMKYKRLWL